MSDRVVLPCYPYGAPVVVGHRIAVPVHNHNCAVSMEEDLVLVLAPHAVDMVFLGVVQDKVDDGELPLRDLLSGVEGDAEKVGKISHPAYPLGRQAVGRDKDYKENGKYFPHHLNYIMGKSSCKV